MDRKSYLNYKVRKLKEGVLLFCKKCKFIVYKDLKKLVKPNRIGRESYCMA